ncbi:putative reverse transcriptase domain-containing protein [Tanacetum coccineum]
MVGAGHAAYTDRFHELARMVAAIEPKTIQKDVQISDALTDEAVRNGLIKKVEKRGNVGEPNKDRMIIRGLGLEIFLLLPQTLTCFNCNRPGHLAKDCRGGPRNVSPINARNPIVRACYECGSTDHVKSACSRWNRAQGRGKNHPNQVDANNGGKGHGNQGNQARGRAFMLGAEEARQATNIVTVYSNFVRVNGDDFYENYGDLWFIVINNPFWKVGNQGNVGNQNGNVVNENVQENVGNAIVNGNRVGCSYKDFLAYNPKEYDGKGGAVVLTRWIEKMESVHDMSGCSIEQKVKYNAGSFVGKALTWWNSQICTLSQEVAVSMS